VTGSDAIIYIVDDETEVLAGLSRLLRSYGWQAETFEHAEAFLARVPTDGIGCCILDMNMPGMSGEELHVQLLARNVSLPVVFLTGRGTVGGCAASMKRGAVDFLEKPVDSELLIATLERAIARCRERHEQQQQQRQIEARLGQLSQREREVMQHVIRGRLNKQIAADLGIAEKTVKVHRSRVMQKVGVRSVAQLVHLCDQLGGHT
jgi:RNA polymerase sigma factor (sigma-70 family)